jgi:hypothetical protein
VIAAGQNGKVFGLRGYRHGCPRVSVELPGCYLESGEDVIWGARRELHEGGWLRRFAASRFVLY